VGLPWLACGCIRSPVHIGCALVAALFVVAGCGRSGGDGEGVSLSVTRDFGRVQVDSARLDELPDGATPLGLLRSETGERGRGWAFFVNGVRPDEAAADYELAPGQRVQWDRPAPGAAPTRAVVGAFPEPFRNGFDGSRRPVRVECDEVDSDPCRAAKRALERAGVPVSGSSLGAPGTENVTRLVVALWPTARIVRGGYALEAGPEQSGVYARFAAGRLELLDERGRVARRAPAGTALIAALRPRADELVWLVTALDPRGLADGVAALEPRHLRNAYAVAVTGATVHKLPL
jgi:Domain of unknown function (DUF4430)